MERGHEFAIKLPGGGTFVVMLLEGVSIEQKDGATIGRWPAFDLEATGDSEAQVYQELVGRLHERTSSEPGSSAFEAFAGYLREHGIRLSDEEAAARELASLRKIAIRWRVTDDEQYMVRLFGDVDVQHDSEGITVRAFGIEAGAQTIGKALNGLIGAVKDACGTHDAPAPGSTNSPNGTVDRRASGCGCSGAGSRRQAGVHGCARETQRDNPR